MLARQAKAAARQWVLEEVADAPNFHGAFFHGSTNWLPDDAALPTGSDVDVMVVFTDPQPPVRPGKFLYRGVLLEVSHLPREQLVSPEFVLGQSHLAGSFRAPSVIADPTGQLTALQAAVARDYARRRWVRARCEHVQQKMLRNLAPPDEAASFHDQVLAWLFAAGLTTHLLLVAGLKNPTVRRRYLAARELLADYGRLDFHETLLALLGCADLSQERAARHLDAVTAVFDTTKTVVRTPFPFASDLSESARPIAIDGSRELIERGDHREAVFWLAVTYSRCRKALHHDAPALLDRFEDSYRRLLGDLGIASPADLERRGEAVRASLPQVWAVAEAIVAANPAIEA